ncbi:MAG: hypothetical protein ACJARD_001200 [Alphaproteobacteria bacterium]|jgi:hypothetical protein
MLQDFAGSPQNFTEITKKLLSSERLDNQGTNSPIINLIRDKFRISSNDLINNFDDGTADDAITVNAYTDAVNEFSEWKTRKIEAEKYNQENA